MDEPIFINGWTMIADGYPISYMGKVAHLTPGESSICWTLLKAHPRGVKLDTLMLRMDSAGNNNTFSVLLSRIRAKLRTRGMPDPVATLGNKLYRWRDGGQEEKGSAETEPSQRKRNKA